MQSRLVIRFKMIRPKHLRFGSNRVQQRTFARLQIERFRDQNNQVRRQFDTTIGNTIGRNSQAVGIVHQFKFNEFLTVRSKQSLDITTFIWGIEGGDIQVIGRDSSELQILNRFPNEAA